MATDELHVVTKVVYQGLPFRGLFRQFLSLNATELAVKFQLLPS
jgi:hypothetical protein